MPSTHTSLYYHIVFSTKYRVASIQESWQERLHSYIERFFCRPFRGFYRLRSFRRAAPGAARFALAPG